MVRTVAGATGDLVPRLLPGLRGAYDASPEGVCAVLDEELSIVYVNRALLRLQRRQDDHTLIGRSLSEIFPVPAFERLLRALRTGRPLSLRGTPYIGPGGEVRHWDVTAHPLVHGGSRVGLIVTVTDTTRRVRHAGAAAAELQTILDGIADAVIVLRGGLCVRVNAAAVRLCAAEGARELLGATQEELMSRYRVVCMDGSPLPVANPSGLAKGVTAKLVRRDGTAAVVFVAVAPLTGPDGEPSLVCVARDVTVEYETKRALDEALAESRRQAERLEAIIESIPVGVRIWDRDGRLRRQNRRAAEILGPSGPGLTDPVAMDQVRVGDGQASGPESAVGRALRGERVERLEITVEDAAGVRRHLAISAAPLHGPDGAVAEAVSVFVDESDRHRLERLKDEFLAILAHELRNPLAGAQASLQAARRALAAGEGGASVSLPRVARHLQNGLEQVARVGGILANLLEVGRVGTVRAQSVMQVVDLVALCRRTVHEASASDPLHTYAFETNVSQLHTRADPHGIAEVLTCLLSNARKYSGPGLPIRVELERTEDRAAVRVRDRGVGVPRGEEEHIFDGFYRAENVRGPGGPSGLGIGLFVARTLVAQHDGVIGVEGNPGGGSVFTFVLPLDAKRGRDSG